MSNPPGHYVSEAGGPYCAAASGVPVLDTLLAPRSTPGGGVDRRSLLVPIVNYMAQYVTGGNNATVPVAAFGTFFLTQPFEADPALTYIYGEMTGLVGSSTNIQIARQVQLYPINPNSARLQLNFKCPSRSGHC
jgi:hypothetical protein